MTPVDVVRAVYEVLSGRAGEPRDWNRFRTCYHPQASLIPVSTDASGRTVVDVFDVDGYIVSRTPMLAKADFHEVERRSECHVWGHVAHVLSEYDSRRTPDGEPFATGTNSVQLVEESGAWRIISVTWAVTGA